MILISNLLTLVLWPIIWSILENVPDVLEKNVYSASVACSVLYKSVMSVWSKIYFKSNIFLLIFCLSDLYVHCWKWGIEVPYCYCIAAYFCLLIFQYLLYMLRCSDFGVHIYLQLLYTLDELIPLSLYHDLLHLFFSFWLKVYFVWYEFSYPFSILVSICMKYLLYVFPSLHFQSICILKAEAFLALEKAQQCSLHAASSAEVSIDEDCRVPNS